MPILFPNPFDAKKPLRVAVDQHHRLMAWQMFKKNIIFICSLQSTLYSCATLQKIPPWICSMKKVFAVLIVLSALTFTGCANGPIRNFFRGAACYWCGTGPVSTCDTCTTTSNHTSFAPSYDAPIMPGVENLPHPGTVGPAK